MRLTLISLARKAAGSIDYDKKYGIIVKQLSWLTGPNQLKEFFSQYGKIRHVHIPIDEKQGISRGIGFVTFDDESGVRNALEDKTELRIDGKNVTVVKNE